jgi:hypothetical protein
MTPLPKTPHRGACGRAGRLCSLPPAVLHCQGPSLPGWALRSSTCGSNLPLVDTRVSRRESSRELVCPRVAGQCSDMRLLPSVGPWTGRPGAAYISVCGDLPFNDSTEDTAAAKLCAVLMRNGERVGGRLWAIGMSTGGASTLCPGECPRITTSHVRETGGIAREAIVAISVTSTITARQHQGEQHATHYRDKRSSCPCHCGLLSPLCPLSPIHPCSSEAECIHTLFLILPSSLHGVGESATVLYRFFSGATAPPIPSGEETRGRGRATWEKGTASLTGKHDIFGALSGYFQEAGVCYDAGRCGLRRECRGIAGHCCPRKCWGRWAPQR